MKPYIICVAISYALVLVSGCADTSSSTRPATIPQAGQTDIIPDLLAQVSEDNLRRGVFYLAKDPLPFRKVNYAVPGHSRNSLAEADAWIEKQLRGWGYRVDREVCKV